jgi:tRNA 2-thiocytidine biosynthesis protein TtcA
MDILVPQPPWTGLGKKLESTIRKALFDYHMLENVHKIAVALSGGKDSLTLLFFLKAISGRGFPNLEIHAILVNGEFSCGAGVNVDYLKKICDKLEVNFIIKESTQKLETLECYSCSRERRSLLFEAAKSVGACSIAFGHHLDDNAETILMNLLHKGEFAGNLPKLKMHDYGITIIRPLIYVTEADIKIFAQQHGFMRILCKCPVGQNSMRTKVDRLLEDIEGLYPNARQNIARAGLLYGSDKASRKSNN